MRYLLPTSILIGALAIGSFQVFAQDTVSRAPDDAARSQLLDQLRALHWIRGPQQVWLFGNSELTVPAGYLFLNPDDTAKLERLGKYLGSGVQYYLMPQSGQWEAFLNYYAVGYIKDDHLIDADAILKIARENTHQANEARRERGWDEVKVIGWQTRPHYDDQTHVLEWAVRVRDERTNAILMNFNMRFLGRNGVTSVLLIAPPQNLAAAAAECEAALAGFAYLPGQRYVDYRPGDRLARYGLAALITGGIAVAAKTGLWSAIVGAFIAGWKFIAAALVAMFAGIAKRFKRKSA